MDDKEKQQLQAQIATLTQQLADTQDALNKAQTANRRLVQDNQNLRYKLQAEWHQDPGLHTDPRIHGKVTE